MENSKYRIAIWMRVIGRVISLLAAGFFLAFLVGGAIDEALSEEVEAIETEIEVFKSYLATNETLVASQGRNEVRRNSLSWGLTLTVSPVKKPILSERFL